ncbi:hypothetical protein [Sphingomonas sp. SUN039]|uniref:hypothetical protein n=1 Tax=Sphingomonas sp. SUN039 TaxID=2937787 RepID=UPI00216400BD|nr:hypothetical protein [Sphingomonas sp. SUN039]UVO54926.1 hypothetical protein M0209_12625 [Sphingomonas sp. SUN039]
MTTPPARAVLAPEWLAHRYDETHDAIHMIEVPRAVRRREPFLVDAHLTAASTPTVLSRGDVLSAALHPAPLHFIFHSAYCCSTLLANAFDRPGLASSLKEPQLLADMVGWRHRGGDQHAIGRMLDQSLTLLARPFEAGEAMIVKPSNVVNGLAQAMMNIRPDAKAVLLYAPLRGFLASIARKGMWGRLWVRELLAKQLADGTVDLGFNPRDYLLHTDLQAAAVGWLAQKKLFQTMATRWPDRVRTLDSDVLVARPHAALRASAALFGLDLDDATTDAIVADVFARNAKDGTVFAEGQRGSDRAAGEAVHGEEIEKVAIWADVVARDAGIAAELPAPLI